MSEPRVPPPGSHDASLSEETLTVDSVLSGRVQFVQPRSGYRVNVDSILLVDFARQGFGRTGRRASCAIDLGAGVGLVGLLLAEFGLAQELVLIEREPELAALAQRNLSACPCPARILVSDAAELGAASELRGRAELVCSNPPFYDPEHHRPSASALRGRARFGALSPFLSAAAALLAGAKARAVFAYPARGLPDLLEAAAVADLIPKRLRFVHPMPDRPARLCLIELRRARPGGLTIEPPLFEWLSHGSPTPEMQRISAGRASDRT